MYRLLKKNNNKGFTLVELLAELTIVSIIMVAFTQYFHKYYRGPTKMSPTS